MTRVSQTWALAIHSYVRQMALRRHHFCAVEVATVQERCLNKMRKSRKSALLLQLVLLLSRQISLLRASTPCCLCLHLAVFVVRAATARSPTAAPPILRLRPQTCQNWARRRCRQWALEATMAELANRAHLSSSLIRLGARAACSVNSVTYAALERRSAGRRCGVEIAMVPVNSTPLMRTSELKVQ